MTCSNWAIDLSVFTKPLIRPAVRRVSLPWSMIAHMLIIRHLNQQSRLGRNASIKQYCNSQCSEGMIVYHCDRIYLCSLRLPYFDFLFPSMSLTICRRVNPSWKQQRLGSWKNQGPHSSDTQMIHIQCLLLRSSQPDKSEYVLPLLIANQNSFPLFSRFHCT